MVGGPTAGGVKGVVPLGERVAQLVERPDGAVHGGRERVDPAVPAAEIVERQRPIGAPGRVELGERAGAARVAAVRLEIVDRIVGAADDAHVELPQEALRGEVVARQLGVAVVEDLARGLGPQQLAGQAERKAELEVRPVVERIAQRVRDRLGPGLELLPVGRLAGDRPLGDAVGAHRPPLVVVAVEPDLRHRPEPVIVGHLLRRQVAVVVEDRLLGGDPVIEVDRGRRVEQEVFVEERFHDGFHEGRSLLGDVDVVELRRSVVHDEADAARGERSGPSPC